MSIPQRLYNSFRSILGCELIRDQIVNDKSIAEFQQLLVRAQPNNEQEVCQRSLIWGMYQSNQVNFMKYINDRTSRVGPLILWTESKRIAQYFRLKGSAHVSYTPETGYSVVRHKNNPHINGCSKRPNKHRTNRTPQSASDTSFQTNVKTNTQEYKVSEYQPLSQVSPRELLCGVEHVEHVEHADPDELLGGVEHADPNSTFSGSWADATDADLDNLN
jgi:hypothetical protein